MALNKQAESGLMQTHYYIIIVVACGLLLGCQKQQAQTVKPPIILTTNTQVVALEKKTIVVRGFYIGMPKEEVLTMLDTYGLTNRIEGTGKLGNFFPVNRTVVRSKNDGFIGCFYYNNQSRLVYIMMDRDLVNFVFNAAQLTSRDVAQEIIRDSNLPEMVKDHSMDSGLYYYQDENIEIGVIGGFNPLMKMLYFCDVQFGFTKWQIIYN